MKVIVRNCSLIFFFLVNAPFFIHGQITFQKSYDAGANDELRSVQPTADGGYIIAGYYDDLGSGNDDFYFIKTDNFGNTQWSKRSGSVGYEQAVSVKQTFDGGYIAIGNTLGFNVVSPSALLIKLDANGNVTWTKIAGNNHETRPYMISQTSDSGYITAGNLYWAGTDSVFILKTDVNGNKQWANTFYNGNCSGNVTAQQTIDGGFILSSCYFTGSGHTCVVKMDAGGNVLWTKIYNNVITYYTIQTNDGGYLFAGSKVTGANTDYCIIKADSAGNINWAKTFGGSSGDYLRSVTQTTDGGYAMTGFTLSFGLGSQVYNMKTDSTGSLQWSKACTGIILGSAGLEMFQASDGGYVIGGTVTDPTYNFFLIKTDSLGNSGCLDTIVTPTISTPTLTSGNLSIPAIASDIITTDVGAISLNLPTATYVYCINAGVSEVSVSDQFKVFPNPASDHITFSFADVKKDIAIVLYNSLMKKVFEKSYSNTNLVRTSVPDVPSGIYFFKVIFGTHSYKGKVIISK